MKYNYIFFYLLLLGITTGSFSQVNEMGQPKTEDTNQIYHTYKDHVEDEDGNRLVGVKVKTTNGSSDITNSLGMFNIKVRFGDLITLSKDGKIINSFVYDGSNEYYVDDDSKDEVSRVSKNKQINQSNTFKKALDSANYFVKKNPAKSIQYVEKALNSTTNKEKNAKAYVVLADAFFELKQYDLAESNYKTAYKTLGNSISLQLKLAKTLSQNKHKTASEKLFNKVIQNKKAIPYQKIIAYDGIASVYKDQGNYKKSLQQLKKGLNLAQEHQITPKITDLNSKIADVMSISGNYNESQTYMSNSIKSAKKENINRAIIQRSKAADFYSRNNSIDKEIKLRKENLKDLEFNEIEEIASVNDEKISPQKLKYEIGNAFEKKANYTEAISYYKESAADAVVVEDIETEKEAIQGLSEVYAKIGDDSNALKNYKKYTQLFDIIYKQKEKEITKAVALGKELVVKQNRIFGLEKDRELNKSKIDLFNSEQNLITENSKRQKLIIYSLIAGLLLMLVSLFYMMRSNKQRKLANNLLALKSLRSQMNPHFIFNALNSVNSFIASNDERTANRYLTDFSTLMRSVLENSEQDFIPLEKEIELLNLYLKLEHSRFEDKFDFEFNIADNVKINEFQIPPMLLQPYIENAVWHGLRYKREKGLLRVSITQNNSESLKITITDDGIGRKKSKALKSKNQLQQKSKGMQNIKQRVAILNEMYADKVDVFIDDLHEDETGTKVVLTLKKD